MDILCLAPPPRGPARPSWTPQPASQRWRDPTPSGGNGPTRFRPHPTQLLNRERLASFPKHPVKVTAGDGAGIRGGAGTRGDACVWSAGGFPPAIHRPSVGVPRAPACATGKVRWPSLGHRAARPGPGPPIRSPPAARDRSGHQAVPTPRVVGASSCLRKSKTSRPGGREPRSCPGGRNPPGC